MRHFVDKTFVALFDRDSGATFEDASFERCVFMNCSLSETKDVRKRSTVRNVELIGCRLDGYDYIGPAVLEDVTIDGLSYSDLVLAFGPLFRHVTLRHRVGAIKINAVPDMVDRSPGMLADFAAARTKFYSSTDWALDISEAEFQQFEIEGVPADLIRRDPVTQAIVRRRKVAGTSWQDAIPSWNEHWSTVIEMALDEESDEDIVLVAPKAVQTKKFKKLVDGIENLRDLGIAERE